MMLLGELPELEETVAGKELIQIGEQRGEKRGEKRGETRRETRLGGGTPGFSCRAAWDGPSGNPGGNRETHPSRSETHDAVSRAVPVARRSDPMAGPCENQRPRIETGTQLIAEGTRSRVERFNTGKDTLDIWSSRDALILKALTIVLSRHLALRPPAKLPFWSPTAYRRS